MTEKPVVIFGTGDFAQVAAVYLAKDSERDVCAYTVDGEYVREGELLGTPVIAFEELIESHPPDRVDLLVATGFSGMNSVRRDIYSRCKDLGYCCVSYVSSRSNVMSEEPVGDNTFIFEANVIQPFVTIGANVVVWSGNHIGHHSMIADHCFIASHAVISGRVSIGERSFVGVNATLRDGVTVGPQCLIGAGAVVLADQPEGAVLATTPTAAHRRKSWELRGF